MTSRRDFIRNTSLFAGSALLSPAFGFNIGHRNIQPENVVIGHGEHQYKVDKGWAKISVNSTPLFNCHEMVQDSKGRLIMLGDHTNNNVLIFDKSGALLDTWGHAYPGGHGLSIGQEGTEESLLITDCGYFQNKVGKWDKQAGLVVKTTLDGRLIFALGHPKTIGVYKEEEPFMPTETAIAPNGDIYVADGYGSDYIIQYDSKGKYIRHFGGHNNVNPEHNLRNAHGVTVDLRDKSNPKLVCTSRDENCFKVFTLDGKFVQRIDLPGMHICRPVMHGKNMYAGVCWSKDAEGKTRWDASGFVTILNEKNQVVSNPGGAAPVYKNGVLQPTLQAKNAVFDHGHDVCVDSDNNVYVCQWNANYTAPIKLTRV